MSIVSISKDGDLYRQALELRYELFFKGYDLPKGTEIDELEDSSEHIGIVEGDILVAYGRLTELSPGHFKISQIIVQPHMQGRGYGTNLLSGVIKTALQLGARSIELNSQVSATALYRKQGFKVQGAQYPSKSTGVPHVKMVLESIT